MMDFSGLFEMQGMLFGIMLLGLFLERSGILKTEGRAILTDLVIMVTLPASILKSFQVEFNHQILMSCLVVFIVAVLIQLGAWILSMVLYPNIPEARKKVLQYATICSNSGILGNSIAEGIFGGLGLLYASIYVIPQRTFMWSVGLTYFTEAPDKKTLVKKVMTHPCILSVLAGFLIMLFQIPLPGFVSLTIRTVANANTFLAMLLVGSILADVKLRTLPEPSSLYYSFIRLVLIPLLVLTGCRLGHVDAFVTGVSVVLSGMPAASVTAVMALKYKKDEIFATKCVVLSTLLSMVTVPLWCLFLR
ncbi:MAG: AEC family transporter [Lachnospiraceae bacterium]|nr:AEC family transporter [Lachnospiraceae bacterium]